MVPLGQETPAPNCPGARGGRAQTPGLTPQPALCKSGPGTGSQPILEPEPTASSKAAESPEFIHFTAGAQEHRSHG